MLTREIFPLGHYTTLTENSKEYKIIKTYTFQNNQCFKNVNE